ncbi:MAG: hypothetical protein OSB62_02965 [Alphaproteobacteria bacterium]|nr:hypothetical protein [Alphaproteobacteria bacterium]
MEALSRQLTSIRNILNSFAGSMNLRVEDKENTRTVCINISGAPSIYWPAHPEADSRGCISHSDMIASTVSDRCLSQPSSMGGGKCHLYKYCFWGTNNGDSMAVTHPRPRYGSHI